MRDDTGREAPGASPWPAAALREPVCAATADLERLQALLAHACGALLEAFHATAARVRALEPAIGADAVAATLRPLDAAVTALQFQDLSSQLIGHATRRLQQCADQLARAAAAGGGEPPLAPAPLPRQPVAQVGVTAGAVELFSDDA